MSAEQLIALEAALSDLSALYVAARTFTALRERAETELLPAISALGSRLRGLVRAARLTDEVVDGVSREILGTAAHWHRQLEGVRRSGPYQQALAALADDDQTRLSRLIPEVLAGLSVVRPPPSLYFPVSPASARRRPGVSPFSNARECADTLGELVANGLIPEAGGSEWWDRELPAIVGADTPATLETPIALHLTAGDVRVAVFCTAEDPSLHVYTPRLRAPLSVILASAATDEWWEAYEDSYSTFRDALRRELEARGHRLSTWTP